MHSAMASVSTESYTLPRPRAAVDGNLESERVVVGEAPAHDGAEGVMERIGGRGSDAYFCRSQPARFCHPFSYWLTLSIYVSCNLPYLRILLMNTYRLRSVVSCRDADCIHPIIVSVNPSFSNNNALSTPDRSSL